MKVTNGKTMCQSCRVVEPSTCQSTRFHNTAALVVTCYLRWLWVTRVCIVSKYVLRLNGGLKTLPPLCLFTSFFLNATNV